HATDAQVVNGPARPRSIAEQDEVEPAGAKVPLPAVPRIALIPDRRGKRLVVTGEWASAMPCRVGSCQAKDTDLVRAAGDGQLEGMVRRNRAPGRVRVEAVPLVEEDALRALVDRGGVVRHLVAEAERLADFKERAGDGVGGQAEQVVLGGDLARNPAEDLLPVDSTPLPHQFPL